ncbi:MAG: hypothetical protein ACI37R_05475 [Candidatus Avigastranaerophilus sp.]
MHIKENIKAALICAVMPSVIALMLFRHSHILLASGLLVIFLSLAAICIIIPKAGFFVHKTGSRAGNILGKYLAIAALFLVYICAVLPTGILMKIVKRDRLRLKKPDVKSYWIKYDGQNSDYENQF